jgi:predicted Zn finger-like uncharacterized protein
MLIGCPGCKANFIFDDTKIDEQGVKLRCFRCKTVFKIVRKKRIARGRGKAASAERSSQIVKFVVAHESQSFCEAVMRVVANEPFLVYDSNDGGEAMAIIERVKPDVVLLDVALPTMYGFEICEAMRQNPLLAHTKIILLAAIYDKRRYRRDPASMYGADDVIEKHRIPDELVAHIYALIESVPDELRHESAPMAGESEHSVADEHDWLPSTPAAGADCQHEELDNGVERVGVGELPMFVDAPAEGSGVEVTGLASTVSTAEMVDDLLPVVEIPLVSEPLSAEMVQSFINEVTVEAGPATSLPATSGILAETNLPEGHVKARRLARIIVSDIALYNTEKVKQGIKEDSILVLLADEYAEGQALYVQRVAAEIRTETNYLEDAWQQLIAKKKREYGI